MQCDKVWILCFVRPQDSYGAFVQGIQVRTVMGSSKIPTVIYYDQAGNMKCAGAETTLAENIAEAEDEEWNKVEW